MRLLLTLLVALCCVLPVTAGASSQGLLTRFTFTPDASPEPLTLGQNHEYTGFTGIIRMSRDASFFYQNGNGVTMSYAGGGIEWYLHFAGADGQPLAVGQYNEAGWLPFEPDGHPGMAIHSYRPNRTSTESTNLAGSYEVKRIVYDDTGAVTEFWATYEFRCGPENPLVTGEAMYRVDSATPNNATTWGRIKTLYR